MANAVLLAFDETGQLMRVRNRLGTNLTPDQPVTTSDMAAVRTTLNATATQVTLGLINVVDYTAHGDGTTDDTAYFQNAINAATSGSVKELLIPAGTYRLKSITFPDSVTLRFARGATLLVDAGETVSINGSLDAGLYQIFSGAGRVTFAARLRSVMPVWWGADPLGLTDSSPAFNAALETGKDISVSVGDFHLHSKIGIRAHGQAIVGDSRGGSRLTAAVNGMTLIGNATGDCWTLPVFRDITLACAPGIVANIAIHLEDLTNATVERVTFTADGGVGGELFDGTHGFKKAVVIYGHAAVGGSYCNRISNCWIELYESADSVGVESDADTNGFGANSTSVVGCRIRANGGHGIYAKKCNNVVIRDNTIEGNTLTCVRLESSDGCIVTGNRFEVAVQPGIRGVVFEDDSDLNISVDNFWVYPGVSDGIPVVLGTGTGNDVRESMLGAQYDKRFGGRFMLNAPNAYAPAHNPRAALDVYIKDANDTANFIFGMEGANLPAFRLSQTRRSNYHDVFIGRNLDGKVGTDNYQTLIDGSFCGYSGLEFRTYGNIGFFAKTGATVAGATIATPDLLALLDAPTNTLRMGGARESTTNVATKPGTALEIGPDSAGGAPIRIGNSKLLNYSLGLIGRNLRGVSGSDNYQTGYTTTDGYTGIELGYQGVIDIYCFSGATVAGATVAPQQSARFDADTTAGNTRFQVWENGVGLGRVKAGLVGSLPAGARVLYIE